MVAFILRAVFIRRQRRSPRPGIAIGVSPIRHLAAVENKNDAFAYASLRISTLNLSVSYSLLYFIGTYATNFVPCRALISRIRSRQTAVRVLHPIKPK
jgi:hypothetical protein